MDPEYSKRLHAGLHLVRQHETGVFTALKEGQSKSVDQLAAECEIEPYLLNSIDLYLLVCAKILERDGDKIRLTEFGAKALFTDTLMTFCWGAVGGYSIVLTELIPAMRRKVKYGVDFERTRRGHQARPAGCDRHAEA